MAINIYTGRTNSGTIPNILEGASDDFRGVMAEVVAGNSQGIQFTNVLNQILEPMEKEVPRKIGTPLPIKIHNVKFTKGGVETSAKEFRPYMDKFDMEKSQGYNVMAFDYNQQTVLDAENEEINLDAMALDSMRAIRGVYTNKYLSLSRLKAIITGTTQSPTIPTVDGGTTGLAGYTRAFGFARGEDYSDFLTTSGATTRNFYRTIKTATMVSSDITDLIDDIEDTNEYSGKGVVVLAHPRIVSRIALLANAPENKDIAVFGTVTSAFGADWKVIPGMDKDFMIFLDKGYLETEGRSLLVRGVEKAENQRGLGIVFKNDNTAFKDVVDMDGAKLRVFPEEWYQGNRLAGGILDINATRFHASGFMQAASATALETFVATMDNYFTNVE